MGDTERFLLVWFVVAACTPPLPPEPPPAPERDGSCDAACDNLARLQCHGHEGSPGPDEAYGTDDDMPCAVACRKIILADEHATLYQACVAAADSCESADECFVQ